MLNLGDMPKSQKAKKPKAPKKTKTKVPKKSKVQPQISVDDEEESLLLGDDDLTQLPPSTTQKSRKLSLETSLLEEELLNDTPPLAIKKSKRRKTRSCKSDKTISISDLDVSLNVSKGEEFVLDHQVLEEICDDVDDVFYKNLSQRKVSTDEKLEVSCNKKDATILNSNAQTSEAVILQQQSPVKSATVLSDENSIISPVKLSPTKTHLIKTSPSKSSPLKTLSPTKTSPSIKSPSKMPPSNCESPLKQPAFEAPNVLTDLPHFVNKDVVACKDLELEEVDIYSDLSNDNVDTALPDPEGTIICFLAI